MTFEMQLVLVTCKGYLFVQHMLLKHNKISQKKETHCHCEIPL